MEKFKKSMKELSGQYESSDEGEDDSEESDDVSKQVANGDDDFEEWDGFEEGESGEPKAKGILKRVYAASSGSEEDGTEVTIEAVELNTNLEEIAKLNYVNLQKSQKVLEESIDRAKKYAVIAGAERPKNIQKKKKFRYLTKSERRANNRKAIDNKKKSRKRD